MNTFSGAYNGALQGWNGRDFIPAEQWGWDTYPARNSRYTINEHYANNQAYASINSYVAAMIHQKKLYRDIRDVRNPSARIVDFNVAKMYPGALDMETAETGAIPIQGDKRIRQACIHFWDTSSFSTLKNIYVRDGATLGDVFIKLVNDPREGCIYGEILHPSKVTEYKRDKQGLVTYAVIEYIMRENVGTNSQQWSYKEVIETDGVETHFATYKNNTLHAYYTDENGKPIAEWDTGYGFIPLSMAQHDNRGLESGACSFFTSIPKIDEINDAASLLNDQIRNAVQIAFLMPGTSAPRNDNTQSAGGAEITYNRDKRTNIPIIHAGKDATAIPLIADIDISAALKNIESMEAGLERENPVLAMYKLWDAQQISGVAVSKLYDPVVAIIKLARSNYDGTLVNAHQLAIAMGAYHGYPEYSEFGVEDYMNGNLKHTIKDRTVFDDSVEKPQKIQALTTIKDQPSKIAALILNELDYDQKTIKDVVAQLDEQQAAADEAAARAFMATALGSGNDGESEPSSQVQPPANGNGTAREVETASVS
jgi:hypothetical protein